ncbi:GIY-YIG nuclease family protein [uncultured Modestobacter sp.]|uniref:GIY-YIG nuclease family protein n=1 Tax=uncultured Modestobacter sp. TaxID=380048 RepID=UPI002620B161|nr:GIY-YIG nuclease family protein [uncultured Modestobacter sp.]
MTLPEPPQADQRCISADLLEPRWRSHAGLTHAQWQDNRREVLARRAEELTRNLADDAPRWPGGLPAWRVDEYQREAALHQWAEELASQLLTVAGELGWGSGDPLEDAFSWVHRVANERGIISSPSAGNLTPPRMPDPSEFERFRHQLPSRGHVVYVLLDTEGQALYVGQTGQPRVRIRTHWRSQDWWPEVDRIELHDVADELEARMLEYELTEELAPRHSQVTGFEFIKLQHMQDSVTSRSHKVDRPRKATVVSVGGKPATS